MVAREGTLDECPGCGNKSLRRSNFNNSWECAKCGYFKQDPDFTFRDGVLLFIVAIFIFLIIFLCHGKMYL